MASDEKERHTVIGNFDVIFAKLREAENVEIVKVNQEIMKETETIRLLREAAGEPDLATFVTYYA